MVLLPGCVCCQECGCPDFSAYSVTFKNVSSYDFRCGRPSSIPASQTSDANIVTASQAETHAVRGFFKSTANSYPIFDCFIGGRTPTSFFSPNPDPLSSFHPIGVFYAEEGLFPSSPTFYEDYLVLSISCGNSGWRFNASVLRNEQFSSGLKQSDTSQANIFNKVFFAKNDAAVPCVSAPSLTACSTSIDPRDPAFHIQSPVVFSFSQNLVTVQYGSTELSFPWVKAVPQGSRPDGTVIPLPTLSPVTIEIMSSCFADCDFSTNLCCNPLP